MSKKIKITIIAIVSIIIFTVICIFNNIVSGEINEAEVPKVTIYSIDKEICIPETKVNDYLLAGWSLEPVMEVYNIDQKRIIIKKKDFDLYYEQGWRCAPIVYIYNIKQEQILIYKADFEEYSKLGWYSEPVQKLYNPAGGSIIVAKSNVEDYKKNGYLEAKPVNENDVILLAKVIYAEATQQPGLRVMDRQYVGAVVMNRVRHSLFPNTLKEVIYAPGQYACVGNYWFNQYPPQECLDIAKQLLEGETFGVPSNVVFQAQFRQGKGIWKQVGVHYYCYI